MLAVPEAGSDWMMIALSVLTGPLFAPVSCESVKGMSDNLIA